MAMCCQLPRMVGEVSAMQLLMNAVLICLCLYAQSSVVQRRRTPKPQQPRNTMKYLNIPGRPYNVMTPEKHQKVHAVTTANVGSGTHKHLIMYKQHTKTEHKNWFLAVSFDGERRVMWVTFQ